MQTSLRFTFGPSGLLVLRDLTVMLEPAAGGCVLSVSAEATSSGLPLGAPVLLSGDVRLGGGARPLLGVLQQPERSGPLVLGAVPRPVSMVVPMSWEALDALERHRDGRDLSLVIGANALVLGASKEQLEYPAGHGQVDLPVTAGQWIRQLEQVGAAASVYVVVHTPLHAATGRRAEAVQLLITARRLLADGMYPQAVAEARKVLDILDDVDPVPAVDELSKARDRDKIERWAALRQAVQKLANAAPHADPVTASITWTRPDALAVIASIAALLQRSES